MTILLTILGAAIIFFRDISMMQFWGYFLLGIIAIGITTMMWSKKEGFFYYGRLNPKNKSWNIAYLIMKTFVVLCLAIILAGLTIKNSIYDNVFAIGMQWYEVVTIFLVILISLMIISLKKVLKDD